MKRNMMVLCLAVLLVTFLSLPAFAGTIEVPESMRSEVYGDMAKGHPLDMGVLSIDPLQYSYNPLDNWHLVNPIIEGGNITALAVRPTCVSTSGSLPGVIAALVDTGTIAKIVTTEDGFDWYTRHSIPGAKPYAIIFVPTPPTVDEPCPEGKFVAVGRAMISDSTDSLNWINKLSGGTDDIWDVAYGKGTGVPDGKYVAVGVAGKIMTSDGNLWTALPNLDTSKTLRGVAYGNNTFVAVGDSCKIRTSTDSLNWTTQAVPTGCTATLKSIAFGAGRFVATTDRDVMYTSTNGIAWNRTFAVLAHNLNKVTFLNEMFIAIGNYGTILSSPDGLTWKVENFSETADPNLTGIGIALDNTTYIVVGKGIIMTSPDLASSNWTKWTLQTKNILNSVVYGYNPSATPPVSAFVTAGDNLSIMKSPDAGIWTTRVWGGGTSSYHFKGVTFGDNKFVAVGGSTLEDLIIASNDGNTWTETDLGSIIGNPPTGIAKLLNGIAYGNNTFVAVGAAGTVITSPDAYEWTAQAVESAVTLNGITFGGLVGDTKFIAVGSSGKSFVSPDGETWTAKSVTSTTTTLYGIAYGGPTDGTKFVAVGSDTAAGRIFYSADGNTWTPVTTYPIPSMPKLYGVIWDPQSKSFMAVGEDATILSSLDGITWTVRVNDPAFFAGTAILRSIAYGNNVYVAVGNVTASYAAAGLVLKSDPIVPAIPTNIRATSASASKVNLDWDDKSHEKNFKIYRKLGIGAWTLLTTTAADVTSYSDTTATANSTTSKYSYYIKSCNELYCSASSKVVIVPFQPTGLTATPTANTITLNWTNIANETGYEIYRKTGNCAAGGSWSLIATTAANIVTYTNKNLLAAKTYSYKIRSVNRTALPYSYGYSMYTSCVSSATP